MTTNGWPGLTGMLRGCAGIGVAVCATAVLPSAALADEDQFQADRLVMNNLVASVEVITEDRSDFSVTIEPGSGEIDAPEAGMQGEALRIRGPRAYLVRGCRMRDESIEVRIAGGDYISAADMPRVVVRAPIGVELEVAESTIFGSMGQLGEVDLAFDGCSRMSIAGLSGDGDVSLTGSGEVGIGSAGGLDVTINGSGDVVVGNVGGDLDAGINGSGDITVQSLSGEVELGIIGSGDIVVAAGRASKFDASINGSGDIRFSGVAVDPEISISGSGDVQIAAMEGELDLSSSGSGNFRIGS